MVTRVLAERNRMLKIKNAMVLWACGLACSAAWADRAQDWDRASGVMAVGLPVLAGMVTVVRQDTQGAQQLALSVGSAVAASEVLKRTVHATRPDGSDQRSFPSRHAAVAFSAAAFLDQRYGQEYKAWVPAAYGVAALTGVARVESDRHRWVDVLAGAALGWGSTRLWTTPDAHARTSSRLSVLPAPGGLAIGWAAVF